MDAKRLAELIDKDFPPLRLPTREELNKQLTRRPYIGGNVRLAMGLVYCEGEYEAREKRVLSSRS